MIFSVCSFQGTLLTDFSSVIRNLNPFKSLITGETSYQNSTSLLMGLALRDCCPSLPVFMPKDFARSFRALVGWYFRILGEVLSSLRFLKFPYPNQVSFSFKFGGHLLSHTVSSAVPSAVWVLTIVFGMGTGVAPRRIATKNLRFLARYFRA